MFGLWNLAFNDNIINRNDEFKKNCKESAKIYRLEGDYPSPNFLLDRKFLNHTYADALMLNECISFDSNNIIESFLLSRRNYIPDTTEIVDKDNNGDFDEQLPASEQVYLTSIGTKLKGMEYAKYWHGYLLFLRPMYKFFNCEEIRMIQLVILNLLAILTVIEIFIKIGKLESILFIFSLFAVGFECVWFGIECSIMWYISLIGMIYILLNYEKMKNLNVFAIIVGVLTSFFDFLTTPTMSLCMPMIIYILLKQKKEKIEIKESFKLIAVASILWGISYGIMWFSKLIIVDVLYHREVLQTAWKQATYRIGISDQILKYGKFDGIIRNFGLLIYIYIVVPIVLMVIFTIIITVKNKKIVLDLKKIFSFIIISIIPIVWIFVLNEHDYRHYFFTYRSLITFIYSIFMILSSIMKDNLDLLKEGEKDGPKIGTNNFNALFKRRKDN